MLALLEAKAERAKSKQAEADLKALYRPQPGPQTTFRESTADIAIYGGAAGGGKTWALLTEPTKHLDNPSFGAIVFRRTTVQIRNEGGLWDESMKLYPPSGGAPKEHDLWWKFPSGAAVTFAHLEHEKNIHDYQGAQIPLILWDELTHFTAKQFFYLLSRNRSTCGVKPYVRATCNPDSESWVADLIEWWIDQDTGLPIPERGGVLRWFIRLGDQMVWADKPEDLGKYVNPADGKPLPPKSLTFIPASLTDNKVLMEADPSYMANLLALPTVERERLLGGNWKIRRSDADFFDQASLLVDGKPVADPRLCDAVFAVMDTATKTGAGNDGTGVTYWARSRFSGHPLVLLDYELVQIEGSLLETWLPVVLQNLEALAKGCNARMGSLGVFIEDRASGEILLQQARRRNLRATAIDSRLTALGKDERALSVSGYVHRGEVKLADRAFHKVVEFKGSNKNHLLSQVTSFRIGDKDAAKRADDLLDAFCYGVAIALGDKDGF